MELGACEAGNARRHDLKSSGTDLRFSLSLGPEGNVMRVKIVANIGNLRAYALSSKIMQSEFAKRIKKNLKITNHELPSILPARFVDDSAGTRLGGRMRSEAFKTRNLGL